VSLAEVAALIAAIAFLILCAAVAVPLLRLRHTVDAATETLQDINDRLGPMLSGATVTIESVNAALDQSKVTLDGVNLQLARLDAITGHIAHVTANVANLSTVVSSAAASPLAKAAAFGFGVRRATARRRAAAEEAELLPQPLPRPGRRRWCPVRRLFWLGVGLAVGALVVRQVSKVAQAYTPAGLADTARNSAAGLWESVQDFITDVREGMAQREQEIHEAFVSGQPLTDLDADDLDDRDFGGSGFGLR
jgi:uncharacterized protein YoxC